MSNDTKKAIAANAGFAGAGVFLGMYIEKAPDGVLYSNIVFGCLTLLGLAWMGLQAFKLYLNHKDKEDS